MFNGTAFASNGNDETINLNNYPRDSRERYVASIALEKGISYEEADKLEREEISLFSNDEYIRYKTVDKPAGSIDDGTSYNQDVYIATEVRYTWNRVYNKLVYIEDLGGSYIYVPRTSQLEIIGGAIISVSKNWSGFKVTTRAKTFSINIRESDLR